MSVARRDWVLLLLALRDANEPLDPVRVQSGMFMLSFQLPSDGFYEFEAVESGPFSDALDLDVEQLEEEGLVDHHGVGNYTWSEFTTTPAGLAHAESAMSRMSESELSALRTLAQVKRNVLRRGFRDLMEHLVQNYPAPGKNSVIA